jgi:hypothetical protein
MTHRIIVITFFYFLFSSILLISSSLAQGDTITVNIHVEEGWNIISLPVLVPDSMRTVRYISNANPTIGSSYYGYQYGFVPADSLEYGVGYHVKCLYDTIITFRGLPLAHATIHLVNGWNVIGSLSSPVAREAFSFSPSGAYVSPLWRTHGKYLDRDGTLLPGYGYSIYSEAAVDLELNGTSCTENIAPAFNSPPTPLGEETITAYVGTEVRKTIQASHPLLHTFTLTSSTLPPGASLLPALPVSGSAVSTEFSWIPLLSEVGVHTLQFTATDSCGVIATRNFNIMVQSPNSFINTVKFANNVTGDSSMVYWGIESSANRCLDHNLGETELPMVPARSVFKGFLENDCSGTHSVLDIRAFIGYTQVDTFLISPPDDRTQPMTISWNDLSEHYQGPVTLKDDITGTLLNIDMKAQNSYVLSSSSPARNVSTFLIIASHPNSGILVTSTINGKIFNDLNGDSLESSDEPGLQFFKVLLTRNGVLGDSTTTAADGRFAFSIALEGTYKVYIDIPPGWCQSTLIGSDEYNISTPQIIYGAEFGVYRLNTIEGTAYNDLDSSGAREGGEPGIPGVQLWLSRNGLHIDSTSSGPSGAFIFNNLPSGNYALSASLPPTWSFVQPSTGQYDDIAVTSAADLRNMDIGLYHPQGCTIAGTIFNDYNGNGLQDGGEPGLSNWRVMLKGTTSYESTTDAFGNYSFTGITPGSYSITEREQVYWEQTVPSSPSQYLVTVDSTIRGITGKDFGNITNARIRITLTATNASNTRSQSIGFGVRNGCSYGIYKIDPASTFIDGNEGEIQIIPPIPDSLDARFVNPRGAFSLFGNGSLIDVRNYTDISQVDTFRVNIAPDADGYPLHLYWSHEIIQQSFQEHVTLIDPLGGQTDMKTVDSLTITDARIQYVTIISHSPVLPTTYEKGWNLISIPGTTNSAEKDTLFPFASSGAYVFQYDTYSSRNELYSRCGYWLKFPNVISASLHGNYRTCDTITVASGWNLIGTISSPLPVSALESQPNQIVSQKVFGFNHGYYQADTLLPYHAYWVRASQNGYLILRSSGPLSKHNGNTLASGRSNDMNLSSITISDADNNQQKLYVADAATFSQTDLSMFEMPPTPPKGVFDARFASQYSLAAMDAAGSEEQSIQVTGAKYPLTITWDFSSASIGCLLLIGTRSNELDGKGSTIVSNPAELRIVSSGEKAVAPQSYSLSQNYPNPFNPSTKIEYTLPTQSQVKLKIFNIFGQEIATLMNGLQESGNKSIIWNAGGMASGVYFYRIEAVSTAEQGKSYREVKKMLVVK